MLLQGNLGQATDIYRESPALGWDTGMSGLIQGDLEGFACVAGASGDWERAAQLWGAAKSFHEETGIPRDIDWLAEADARIAAVRSGLGEQAWEAAFARGKAMGLDEAVEYALAGVDSTAPELSTREQPSVGAQPPNLTRRQREVARLVAQGLTNRRIAQDLVISEHTVENHVAHILRKLNLHSREQIASRLTQH